MDRTLQFPTQSGLQQRIRWLLSFRLVFASVLVVATLISRPGSGEHNLFGPSFLGVFTITAAHWIAAIAFFLHDRRKAIRRVWGFAVTQIGWDLFFTTAFVSITGGLDSEFKFLYWLTIAIASILLLRVGAYLAAAFSGFMYGTLLNLQYFGITIPLFNVTPDSALWPEDRIWRSIIVQSIGFFVVALIFGLLSKYLKQTETMLTEKSADLEDLEALMKRIVESLTSGLVTLDGSNRVRYWSDAAGLITGLALQSVRGKDIFEVFPGARGMFGEGSTDPVTEGQPWRYETPFVDPGGGVRILGFSVSPLRHGTDGQGGTLLIFQDLTEFRRLEEQIKRQDRLAALGELAARIAHEIRNPLTSVSGSIQVLQKDLKLEDRSRRLMDIVVRETDRLNQLLTDFLQFARPALPQFEEVQLSELIHETTELFTKSQPSRHVTIEVETADERLSVQGDARQLNQMFWNLFKNASEAMGEKGEIRVVVRDGPGGSAVVEVRDQGSGISEEVRKKIFTPFFTTKTRGTGLGLAMVRRIAEDHHGNVDVESETGVGAVFRVTLPAVKQVRMSDGSV